jgi:hypothetical protein
LLNDRCELRVEDEPPRQSIEERRKSRYRGDEYQSPGADHASSLFERLQPITTFDQVVERTQHEYCIERLVVVFQVASIADLARDRARASGRKFASPCDLRRDRIDDMHTMTVLGKPRRVNPGCTTDVENPKLLRREMPADDLLSSQQLELTEALAKPTTLIEGGLVVCGDLGLDHRLAHVATVERHPSRRP